MITPKSKRIINSFVESVKDSIPIYLDCYESYSFEGQTGYNFAWNMFNEVVVVFKNTGSLTAFLADVNIELVLDSQESYDNAVRETCRLILERAGE